MKPIAIFLTLLVASACGGDDILVLTDAGIFIVPVVDGVPQPSIEWPGDIVDQRGDITPPPSDLAKRVDAWADAENQEHRELFAAMYRKLIIDVGSGTIDLEDVRTWRATELLKEIWKTVPAEQWRPFAKNIADLVRGMNQRGEWQSQGMATLQSILQGLTRG